MKKNLTYPLVLCLLMLCIPISCLAADTFTGDVPADNSSLADTPDLSGAAGSEADLIGAIKTDPTDTANYQAVADVYAGEGESGYKVFVDGNLIDFSRYDNVQPVVVEERTIVPVRAISEGMGADVNWDGSTGTVTITQGTNVITLTVNSIDATVNGNETTLDVPAQMIGDRTMVPLRFVGAALGEQVGWYPSGSVGVIALYD